MQEQSTPAEPTIITLPRTGQRSLTFGGTLLAEAETSADSASDAYSGATGRAARVRLYQTAAGVYVAAQSDFSQWQGEQAVIHHAWVFDTLSELLAYVQGDAPLPLWAVDQLVRALDIEPEHIA
jgi:hypothetical protein